MIPNLLWESNPKENWKQEQDKSVGKSGYHGANAGQRHEVRRKWRFQSQLRITAWKFEQVHSTTDCTKNETINKISQIDTP